MELWYPGNSLAEKHENQQHANVTECTPDDSRKQKRRKQSKIEKRKEPTINFQVLESKFTSCPEASPTDSNRTSGYSTIESTSSNGLDKYDNWKDHQEESTVCGWQEDEDIAKQVVFYQTINDSRTTVIMPQVRSVSDRLYSSRLNTQMSKKRDKYRFSHAATPEEHMQLYKESCSYSYLLLFSRSRPHTVATAGGGELEDQVLRESTGTECDNKLDNHQKSASTGANRSTRKNYLPKPVTALSTTRDSKQTNKHDTRVPSIPTISGCKYSDQDRGRVLHALANRLGVRESIDEPKLLSAVTRPTVPSIMRKKSEDLRLQPAAEKSKESKEESSSPNSQSRPNSKQSKQRRTPHQLPKMPSSNQHRKKSTSSISLSKYFHVNKRDSDDQSMLATQQQIDQQTLEDEGEEDVPINSNASSRLPSPDELDKEDPLAPYEAFPQFVPTDPLGNSNQKEEVIRRKANSLGLMSHKWAKNFIERGFMDGHLPRKVFYEYSKQSRESTAAKKSPKHDGTGKQLSTRQNEKLKELKQLYSPLANNKKTVKPKEKERIVSGINRIQHHSHVSNNRPATRSKPNCGTLRLPPTRPRCSSQQRSRTMAEAELEAAVKKLQEFKLQGLTPKISSI